MSYAETVVVNNGVLFWAIGCYSLWEFLSQWLWTIVRYAEPVVVKHCELCWTQCVGIMACFAEAAGANHCESCWASGCEPWWGKLSQRLTIIVFDTEPVVVNHCELCWDSDCHSWCAMISKYVGIMVCYSEPMVVNHDVLCWTSGCESCWASGCKSRWDMLS
jgi:hypothetical protein